MSPSALSILGTAILVVSVTSSSLSATEEGGEPTSAAVDIAGQDSPTLLNPGSLSAADRSAFYHLSQGADIFPLRLFWTLERSDRPGTLLRDTLGEYGLLPDADNCLPVGLTASRAKDTGIEMLGFNCAACHVGQIEVPGHKLRIDGAPNMVQLFPFRAELLKATKLLFDDPIRLWTQWQRAKKADLQSCNTPLPAPKPLSAQEKKSLVDQDQEFDEGLAKVAGTDKEDDYVEGIWRQGQTTELNIKHLMARMHMTYMYLEWSNRVEMTEPGPGRADAWAASRNMLFNPASMTAPLTVPHLWNISDVEYWHAISNTNSVLDRNLAEALAFGAVLDKEDMWTSAEIENLVLFEESAYKFATPKWPEEVLGKIDLDLASSGETVFKRECAACHEGGQTVSSTGSSGQQTELYRRPVVLLDKIGTDPNEIHNYERDVTVGNSQQAFGDALGNLLEKVIDNFVQLNPTKQARIDQARSSGGATIWGSAPRGYSARRLHGVWASAPFLHNGSVPTLADLLEPPVCEIAASCRPEAFAMGHRTFDTTRIGFTRSAPGDATTFHFDTKVSGNSNGGHLYGTALPASDKRALLEFLKTY